MHVMLSVSSGAVYTVWWISLVIFLVVLVVVAVLLTLILNTVRRIEQGASQIWTVGQNVANNTVHIPLLVTTNRVVDAIHDEAGKILAAATRIQEHAETCPG
ncbi:MAG: hypothetical protein NVS3B14_06900 [Ktedonobacteraceae bacterium]